MSPFSLYETIFKRKSVRQYDLNPLDESILAEISAFVKTLKPLYSDIDTFTKIVSRNEVKSLLPLKAPHYLVVFSEPKDGYLTNAGFMFQQMDLFLSANGIGSCWLGLPKPTKEIHACSDLEFVIMLALGNPAEPLHRESITEFKRKPLDKIGNITEANNLLEAVRLAPSATNSQPWFFTGRKDLIHSYCVKPGFLKAIMYEKMNKIDMGIALCHLWISAEHSRMKAEFVCDATAMNNPPAKHYYISTMKINN